MGRAFHTLRRDEVIDLQSKMIGFLSTPNAKSGLKEG